MRMRKLTGPQSYSALAVFFSVIGLCHADIPLRPGVACHFAEVNEGVRILTTRDDFIIRLSAFDRSARMKTDKSVSDEEFLAFLRANVSAWADEEKAGSGAEIVSDLPPDNGEVALDAIEFCNTWQ
jgi:hypothetical protein